MVRILSTDLLFKWCLNKMLLNNWLRNAIYKWLVDPMGLYMPYNCNSLFDAEYCKSCRKTSFLWFVREYLIGVWHLQQLVVRDATTWPWSWCSSRNPFSPLHLWMSNPHHPKQLTLNQSSCSSLSAFQILYCITLIGRRIY